MSHRQSAPRISKVRSISLQPELDEFVLMLVQKGEFANYSEVVRTALRSLKHEEQERRIRLEGDPKFRKSLSQARAGKTTNVDLRSLGNVKKKK